MYWSRRGPGPWPATPPPDIHLDRAVERVVRLALADRPEQIDAALATFGLGTRTGHPPVSLPVAAPALTRSQREMLRARLRDLARSCGPPDALAPALELVDRALPARPRQLSDRLVAAGLTEQSLHPAALVTVARLWRLPRPTWTNCSRHAAPVAARGTPAQPLPSSPIPALCNP